MKAGEALDQDTGGQLNIQEVGIRTGLLVLDHLLVGRLEQRWPTGSGRGELQGSVVDLTQGRAQDD